MKHKVFQCKLSPTRFHWIIILAACLLYLIANIIVLPGFGGKDIFTYKDAGVNLALGRGFVQENLMHNKPGDRAIFWQYTPLYPFLFGLYSTLVRPGLRQAVAFNAFIDIFRTIVLFMVIAKIGSILVAEGRTKNGNWGPTLGFASLVAILTLPLRSGYGDRPDDLAVTFQLLSLYLLIPRYDGKGFASAKLTFFLFAGMCANLSFLTSPALGMFTVIMVALITFSYSLSEKTYTIGDQLRNLVKRGLVASTGFFVCLIPVVIIYVVVEPTAFMRFASVGFSWTAKGFIPALHGNFSVYLEELSWAWRVGHFFIIFALSQLLVSIVGVIIYIRSSDSLKENYRTSKWYLYAIICSVAINVVIVLLITTPQFAYFWPVSFISLSLNGALIPFLLLQGRAKMLVAGLVNFALIGAVGLYATMVGLFWMATLQLPENQRPATARAELLETIPKGSRVLLTPDLYWLLKLDYYIADPDLVENWSTADYLVVSANGTGVPGKPYVPHFAKRNSFPDKWDLVKSTLNTKPLNLFNVRLTQSAWGYGFNLYRNKERVLLK